MMLDFFSRAIAIFANQPTGGQLDVIVTQVA
jgi:hypothetical protein